MKLFQLTLRDLFWLVALVAMGCGWWADRQESSHCERQLHEELDRVTLMHNTTW